MRLPFALPLVAFSLTLAACASDKPWSPGAEHPMARNVIAGAHYGDWAPAPGYAWDETTPGTENTGVHWSPGLAHPKVPGLIAGFKEHSWVPAPGWERVNPQDPLDLAVRWCPGTPHPAYPHVVAGKQADRWEPQAGYEWVEASGSNMRVQRIQ